VSSTPLVYDYIYRISKTSLAHHTDGVLDVCVSPDSMWLLTCGHDDNLCVWSSKSAIDESENTNEKKKRKRKRDDDSDDDDDKQARNIGLLLFVGC
jgi:WD40 repeat protein